MLAPKRQKYRKAFRGVWRKIAIKGNALEFGGIGLKSIEAGFIKDRQIEAARLILARTTRKTGKFWMRIFPDKPYTKKPPEVTMGAGKGEVAYFVSVVSPGRVLFEIDGVPEVEARVALKSVASKLPVKTKIIKKQ
ncbi:MAG TPA: 50S ribosomal protein L16 [Patescibacteria group bacterium]|nr:50S ribosomal protein L16 [Patescibacteria group bacterium]